MKLVVTISLTLAAVLGSALIAAAVPVCNNRTVQAARRCIEPYGKCQPYELDGEMVCRALYDKVTENYIPGCDANGNCLTYCDSLGEIQCNQVRKCKRLNGLCVDDGANAPPSFATSYVGDECQSTCPPGG
jgi:hypothetical protein